MTEPTAVTLTEAIPAGVSRRNIPWGAQPGQTVYIEPKATVAESTGTSWVSDDVRAALAANETLRPPEGGVPNGDVSLAEAHAQQIDRARGEPVLTAEAIAAHAKANPTVADARMDRLESLLERMITSQLPKAPEPVVVPPEVTTIDARLFKTNPMAALKAAGIDPSIMAPHMPGAKVEPEQRLELTAASLRAELETTMATKLAAIEAREAEFLARQRQAEITAGLQAIDATKFPTTAVMAKQVDDPDFLKTSIAQGFDVLRANGNPNPTMTEVLTALEAHWSKFARWTAPVTAPQATAPAPSTAPVIAQPSAAPVTPRTPAPRPIARGWGQPTDPTVLSALQAALAEAGA